MALAGPSRLPVASYLSTLPRIFRPNNARGTGGQGKQHEGHEGKAREVDLINLDDEPDNTSLPIDEDWTGEEDLGLRWLFEEQADIVFEEEPDTSGDAVTQITNTLQRRALEIENRLPAR